MQTRRSTLSIVLAAGSLSGLATQASADTPTPGDIPDNQAFVSFRGDGYSLKTPEGWGRSSIRRVVTFTDKFNTISIELARSMQAPTIASATGQDVPRLRATVRGFKLRAVTKISRPAGPAILITYRATSPRSAVTGRTVENDVERYLFWKSGRRATVTVQAPRGSDNVDAWRLVTTSFRWIP